MIKLNQWPPLSYGVFTVNGVRFEWGPDEPFVSYMLDGTIDDDLSRQTPGFLNRIYRYGVQNNLPPELWDEQTVLNSLKAGMPPELQRKFFRIESNSPVLMHVTPHNAPIPAGLLHAAGHGNVADDDPDAPFLLSKQSPDQWLLCLKKWVRADKGREKKAIAGPAWWWALHSVALNPTKASTPGRFVGMWLSSFPCRLCRIGARVYLARHPVPGWDGFIDWADKIHNYVTSRK